jgi:1-acyl-sn-glycerol-3-phosphate acyltransferase
VGFQPIARIVCWLFFRLRVVDRRTATRRPTVIVGNHSSPFDFVLGIALFGARPARVRYLIAARYFTNAWAGRVLRLIEAVPVDQRNAAASVRAGLRHLRAGRSIVVMPEGRIAADERDDLRDLSAGALFMAATTATPVTIVTIAGLRDVWPVDRKRPSWSLRRPTVRVHISDYQPAPGRWRDTRAAETARFAAAFRDQLRQTRG